MRREGRPDRGGLSQWTRDQMAPRAARELQDGFYVNLGVGSIPFDDEMDADLINAGKQTIRELPHSAYFDSAQSFAMISGGHIDLLVLGAMEVSENDDISKWLIPGKIIKGMGIWSRA